MSGSLLLRSLSLLVAGIAIGCAFISIDFSRLEWLCPEHEQTADTLCPQTYVLSEDPVVVYVKDFIRTREAAHLVELA